MSISAQQIRLVHSVAFFFLLLCLGYALYTAIVDNITTWTWLALVFILLEGIVLALNRWRCPLTDWAERKGAVNGSVADLYLPKFLADRLFLFSGAVYFLTLLLVLYRLLGG